MEDTDFYEAVSDGADLDPAAADAATLATLPALGDHLSDTVVEDLTGPLPEEAADRFLEAAADPPTGYSYEEFVDRVAESLDVDEGEAERRARAVGATLADHVDDAALHAARDQLPDAYDRLFWVPETEEILAQVRQETDVESDEAAREATTAVLATLGERVTHGEARALAAYLPDEFATALEPEEDVPEGATGTGADDATARGTDVVEADYDVDEFVDQVAERAGVEEGTAREHVTAVTGALVESVPSREFEDALEQLPDEYGAVL